MAEKKSEVFIMRISPKTKRALDALSSHYGGNRSAAIRSLIHAAHENKKPRAIQHAA